MGEDCCILGEALTMNNLAKKKCVPCEGGVPKLKNGEIKKLMKELETGWKAVNNHHLERQYKFPDFAKAFAFVKKIAKVAEQEDHHPNIEFTWGFLKLRIWTHAIDGLSENDFILAAKIDKLL